MADLLNTLYNTQEQKEITNSYLYFIWRQFSLFEKIEFIANNLKQSLLIYSLIVSKNYNKINANVFTNPSCLIGILEPCFFIACNELELLNDGDLIFNYKEHSITILKFLEEKKYYQMNYYTDCEIAINICSLIESKIAEIIIKTMRLKKNQKSVEKNLIYIDKSFNCFNEQKYREPFELIVFNEIANKYRYYDLTDYYLSNKLMFY